MRHRYGDTEDTKARMCRLRAGNSLMLMKRVRNWDLQPMLSHLLEALHAATRNRTPELHALAKEITKSPRDIDDGWSERLSAVLGAQSD